MKLTTKFQDFEKALNESSGDAPKRKGRPRKTDVPATPTEITPADLTPEQQAAFAASQAGTFGAESGTLAPMKTPGQLDMSKPQEQQTVLPERIKGGLEKVPGSFTNQLDMLVKGDVMEKLTKEELIAAFKQCAQWALENATTDGQKYSPRMAIAYCRDEAPKSTVSKGSLMRHIANIWLKGATGYSSTGKGFGKGSKR